MERDTTTRDGSDPITIRHLSHGDMHPSMTPSTAAGVVGGVMGRGLCPASSGGSRWESSFHHGGTALTGQAGIPGMAMATDTPGATAMDTVGTAMVMVGTAMDTVVGTPVTVITRITDMMAIIQSTDMVVIIHQGLPLQVADIHRLTSTGPLTPTNPPMSPDR